MSTTLPFGWINADLPKKIEIVYFISPHCDGTCGHCWSANTNFGRAMPYGWHKKFWSAINYQNVSLIKLSGGEPFLYQDLGNVVRMIRQKAGKAIPIVIFTSGRQFVSIKEGGAGVEETVSALKRYGLAGQDVELQMSADEFHSGAMYHYHAKCPTPSTTSEIEQQNLAGIPLLRQATKNFLAACRQLSEESSGTFPAGKLKVHANVGRLQFHRERILNWMDDKTWSNNVIGTEGLIGSGRGTNLHDAKKISANGPLSLLVIPGARFHDQKISIHSQSFINPLTGETVFLDLNQIGGPGAAIVGWWNLIDRVSCGETANDALDFISQL